MNTVFPHTKAAIRVMHVSRFHIVSAAQPVQRVRAQVHAAKNHMFFTLARVLCGVQNTLFVQLSHISSAHVGGCRSHTLLTKPLETQGVFRVT